MKIEGNLIAILLSTFAASPILLAGNTADRANKRIEDSAAVLQETLGAGDRGIPRDLIPLGVTPGATGTAREPYTGVTASFLSQH